MPPDQRTNYRCEREAMGPVNHKQIIEYMNKIAIETHDKLDNVPYVIGVVRGHKVNKSCTLFCVSFILFLFIHSSTLFCLGYPSCALFSGIQNFKSNVITYLFIQIQWTPPEVPVIATREDEGVSFNLEDEYEHALGTAIEEELVDLAGIINSILVILKLQNC